MKQMGKTRLCREKWGEICCCYVLHPGFGSTASVAFWGLMEWSDRVQMFRKPVILYGLFACFLRKTSVTCSIWNIVLDPESRTASTYWVWLKTGNTFWLCLSARSVTFFIAMIKSLTETTWAWTGLFWLRVWKYSPWRWERHCVRNLRLSRSRGKSKAVPRSISPRLCLFSPDPSMRWCHPHSGCVFFFHFNLSGNT